MVESLLTAPSEELAVAIPKTSGFRVPPETLEATCAALQDPEQAESVRWFATYAQSRNMSRERVATLLKKPNGQPYSIDSIYQVLTGRRTDAGVNIVPIITAIDTFRRTVEMPAPQSGFVETAMFRRIKTYIERTRRARRIGFVFGDMNVGKSACAEELCRRDPSIIGMRMPTRGHLNHVLQVMAARMAMGSRQTVLDLSERIIEAIPEDALLMFDEADQPFSSVRNMLGLATLDFIREIYDRRRCGIVLFMDHAGRDALKNGPNKKRMQRLWRRRIPPLQLPSVPSQDDLALFAERAGLGAAPDEKLKVRARFIDDATGAERVIEYEDNPLRLQSEVTRKDGLGIWLAMLDEAVEMARASRRSITWQAVLKAYAEYAASESEEGKGNL